MLFGVLYLVTPFLWMLPPMIFRTMVDGVSSELAYITAVKYVLPSGLMGLMIAAMFSATASMADSVINVFAGAVTRSIYKTTDKKKSFRVGQICTLVYGGLVILLGVSVPYLGGAEKIVLVAVNLVVGPLILPTIWGLLSPRIGIKNLMVILAIGVLSSIGLKYGISADGFLRGIGFFDMLGDLSAKNGRVAEMAVGTLLPFIILITMEIVGRKKQYIDSGWIKDKEFGKKQREIEEKTYDPTKLGIQNQKYSLLGVFLMGISIIVAVSGFLSNEYQILFISYAVILFIIGIILYRVGSSKKAKNNE